MLSAMARDRVRGGMRPMMSMVAIEVHRQLIRRPIRRAGQGPGRSCFGSSRSAVAQPQGKSRREYSIKATRCSWDGAGLVGAPPDGLEGTVL